MDEQLKEKSGIVVWLHSNKYVNKLKRYGYLHYVSKKMKYAIVYVNKDQTKEKMNTLQKLNFVQKVEPSFNNERPDNYEGLLDEMDEEAKKINKEKEETEFSLFQGLSNFGGTK